MTIQENVIIQCGDYKALKKPRNIVTELLNLDS